MSHNANVSAFMMPDPICLHPEVDLHTAIDRLHRAGHDYAVVIDLAHKPIGVVSARDLLNAYVWGMAPTEPGESDESSLPPRNFKVRVSDVSTRKFTCVADSVCFESLRTPLSHPEDEIVVVVNEDAEICGLITARELIRAYASKLIDESTIEREQARAYNRALQHENEQLVRLTMEDPMLRIGNRRALVQDINTLHARTARQDRRYALLLIDVDHFKTYNDNYGHLQGDQVLLQVVECLQALVRDCTRVYRFGGEAFLVILPETDVRGAKATADRILKNMASFAIPHVGSPEGIVTLSIGVCAVEQPLPTSDWHDVVEAADQALYNARRSGRNQVQVGQLEEAPVRWCG